MLRKVVGFPSLTGFATMTLQTDIQKIYIAYFNRPADAGGLAFWEQRIAGGQASLADLTQLFSGTEEYRALYAGSNNAQVVTAIYKNLFGRDPEPEGLAFWTQGLQQGQFQIGNVAYQTLNGAQLADRATIDNKAAAASDFTSYLNANGGDAAYSGAAIQSARSWLATITDTSASLSSARSLIDDVVDQFNGTLKPSEPPRTFTFRLGADPNEPPRPISASELDKAPIDKFFFGHDRIQIVDPTGKPLTISSPTRYYVEDWSHLGRVEPSDPFLFGVFAALGYAASGGKNDGQNPLKAGESMLFTFQTKGLTKTYLFVDNGVPGVGGGRDNGVGSAVWNLDADVIVNLTGIAALKTTADGLFLNGSLF